MFIKHVIHATFSKSSSSFVFAICSLPTIYGNHSKLNNNLLFICEIELCYFWNFIFLSWVYEFSFRKIVLDELVLCRLNGQDMLELLRGKRLVFVGDSLSRSMWESLVCVLRNSVEDLSRVFEASGKREFRTEGSYSFIFKVGCSFALVYDL